MAGISIQEHSFMEYFDLCTFIFLKEVQSGGAMKILKKIAYCLSTPEQIPCWVQYSWSFLLDMSYL